MSVGGTVIEVVEQIAPEDGRKRVRLWCVDRDDEVAVWTRPAEDLPAVGDRIWWQGGRIFWTPVDKRFVDRPIPKLGFSFDPRPRARMRAG